MNRLLFTASIYANSPLVLSDGGSSFSTDGYNLEKVRSLVTNG